MSRGGSNRVRRRHARQHTQLRSPATAGVRCVRMERRVIPSRRPMAFPRLADLTDRGALGALFGPVRELTRAPMGTVGYSGSRHERLVLLLESGESLRLIHKRT